MSIAGFGAAVGGIYIGMLTGGVLEYAVASAIGKAGNDRLSPFGRYENGRPDPPRARIAAEVAGVLALEPIVLSGTVHLINRKRGSFRKTWLATGLIAAGTVTAIAINDSAGESVAFIAIIAQPIVAALVEANTTPRLRTEGLTLSATRENLSIGWHLRF